MNLQTERIEDHRAQFTIEIESDQLEDAKRKAARNISRRVRIKGFRKGKAPYRLVAQYVGEGAILEEAVESLGDNLYKQALEESEVVPYGPGAFDDFKLEPSPTFIFSVPLQPEVDLKSYLDVRLDFEEPDVSEDDVNEALRQLRLRQVEVLDEDVKVAAPGNRVQISVESEFIDGELPDAITDEMPDAAAEDPLIAEGAEEPEDEQTPYIPRKGDTFVKDENTLIILDPNEDPFVHGFAGNLIGVESGSDVEFELTIPDDDADETIAGRQVIFNVSLNKIEDIAIPELNDEFAHKMSRNRGDESVDLAGLREATRNDLERSAQENAKNEYSGRVLQAIIDDAGIDYPALMLEEHIDELIREFEGNLAQQRIGLEDYFRLTNTSKEDLREQHRDRATASLRQTLALRELVSLQEIEVSDEQIDLRLDSIIAGYGTSEEIRKLFNTPQMRGNVRNELIMNVINAHLVAIGRGIEPSVAIEELQTRMSDEAQLARERNERLQQYREEDSASAPDAADAELDESTVSNEQEATDEVESEDNQETAVEAETE